MMRSLNGKVHLFVVFALASCSMLYEFVLAQNLSTYLGNSILQYNTTVGLYIAFMGFGSLLYRKVTKGRSVISSLIVVEIFLTVVGGNALLALHCLDLFFASSGVFDLYYFVMSLVGYSLISIVGFLTGFELPLLIDIGKNLSSKLGTLRYTLSIDYLGTFFGGIVFTFLVLPFIHIAKAGHMVAILNALIAVYFSIFFRQSFRMRTFSVGVLLLSCVGACLASSYFQNWWAL